VTRSAVAVLVVLVSRVTVLDAVAVELIPDPVKL
jgi:hypothetical protein